jgi:dsDNA-specific endonuclease/ATPase MutS2
LHIEKITPHHQNLSNVEKFNLQIEIFEKALDISMLEQKNTLIVIHGEGKGVLRDKIHAILNQTISVHSYVNQLDTRYGLGATEIFFGY